MLCWSAWVTDARGIRSDAILHDISLVCRLGRYNGSYSLHVWVRCGEKHRRTTEQLRCTQQSYSSYTSPNTRYPTLFTCEKPISIGTVCKTPEEYRHTFQRCLMEPRANSVLGRKRRCPILHGRLAFVPGFPSAGVNPLVPYPSHGTQARGHRSTCPKGCVHLS